MITFKEIVTEDEIDEQVPQQGQQIDPRIKGAELIARCFSARNAAHIAHFLTPSFSQHKALQEFYEGIIPLADSFAEGLIGRVGKFEAFPNVKESSTDPLTIIGNLTKFIDANRQYLSEFSEIQNDVDSILSLLNSVAYKLRELK